MIVIETPEHWCSYVDNNWSDLLKIIDDWHPASREQSLDEQLAQPATPITAPTAEKACAAVRREIAAEEAGKLSPTLRAVKAKEERDQDVLINLFNSAWFGVPESMGSWRIPGFAILCDLCSESHVFRTEEEE